MGFSKITGMNRVLLEMVGSRIGLRVQGSSVNGSAYVTSSKTQPKWRSRSKIAAFRMNAEQGNYAVWKNYQPAESQSAGFLHQVITFHF